MKVVLSKVIDGKVSELILENDQTLKVMFGDEMLGSFGGNTWANIESSGMSEDYLTMIVYSHIEEERNDADFNKFVENLDWGDKK